jgi:hypothetical protein
MIYAGFLLAYSSNMKMEATLVDFQHITDRYIPEGRNLHDH